MYRDGDGRQQIVSLSSWPPKLTIGRSATSDIVLDWDPEVSRLHAQLEKGAAGWVLIDDGISRNGTFINGKRVSGWRRLHDGNVILIGSTSLTYRCGRIPATTPATLRGTRTFVGDARLRPDPFILPTETPFRFALLIVAVLVSTAFTWNLLYFAFNHERWDAAARSCGVGTTLPSDFGSAANAVRDMAECWAPANRETSYWMLAGMLLLLLVALALYLLTPWWRIRRGRLEKPDPEDAADVLAELDRLRHIAGVGKVSFFWQPLKAAPAAFAFGRCGDRKIALSGGLAVRYYRDRAAFRAVVLHELAHLRNRDLDQAYGAVAVWRAFLITSFLPFAALELWRRENPVLQASWRFGVLALLVYLLRNALLRSRESYADALVQSWGEGVPLYGVLGGMPPGGRRVGRWLAMHPAPASRQQALTDPTPLFRFGFWEAFSVGLVATLAIPQIQHIADQLVGVFVSPIILGSVLGGAFLSAAALVIGIWRTRLPNTLTPARPIWPIGVGFAVGSAVGPPLALTEAAGAFAASVTALLLWLLISVVVLGPLPSWIAEGAAHWLAGLTTGGRRRIAYLVAVILTSSLLVCLMSGLRVIYSSAEDGSQRSIIWQTLSPRVWTNGLTTTGLTAVPGLEGLLIALLVLAFGAYTLIGQIPAGGISSPPVSPTQAGASRIGYERTIRPWLRPALFTGLTVGLISVTLILLMRLLAHAQVSAQVRANSRFILSYAMFQRGAIIILAVLGGLLVTAAVDRMPLAGGALTALVASLVGTLGYVFQSTLASCVPAMRFQQSTGPALPNWSFVWQSIGDLTGTAGLLVLLLGPAVAAAVSFVRRRTLRRRHASSYPARRFLALKAGSLTAAVVALIPVALMGVHNSSNGLQDAGRITGPGYQLDLPPGWADVTTQLQPDTPRLLQAFQAQYIQAQMMTSVPPDTASLDDLRRAGGRPGTLDGAPTATVDLPASPGRHTRLTFVLHDQRSYMIELTCHPRDFSYCESDARYMLASWHWRQ